MRRLIRLAATLALLLGGARQANAGFCITLSGASRGNGTFDRGDFSSVLWDTNGGALALTKELISPPTGGALGGSTPGAFGAGDFDIFNNGTDPAAPSATNHFQPATGGYSGMMNLTSLAPHAQTAAAAEPASLTLLGVGALGLAGYAWRRRRRAA
jgi:MYXO-CTERM domain-containing protein